MVEPKASGALSAARFRCSIGRCASGAVEVIGPHGLAISQGSASRDRQALFDPTENETGRRKAARRLRLELGHPRVIHDHRAGVAEDDYRARYEADLRVPERRRQKLRIRVHESATVSGSLRGRR